MKLSLKSLPAIITAVTVVAFGVVATRADDAAVKGSDKSFVTSAYEDGLAEIRLAELAIAKTANADVKAFATHMVTEHSNANTELKTLAESKKVAVSAEPSMVAKGKSTMMDRKTGADFDKAFAESMVENHKKAVALFDKTSKEAKDPDVKALAAKMLPTLQGHLSMAEQLQAKVGK